MPSPRFLTALGVAALYSASVSMGHAEISLTDAKQFKVELKQKLAGSRPLQPMTTGARQLIDSSGLEWFINTNMTFSTTSSASAAASEASYTNAVQATTVGGGNVASTLGDAFDGYYSLAVSLTGATGPVTTGNPAYTIYNQNGPASLSGREVIFPNQNIGALQVHREVFVPSNDAFARWLNVFTNTGGSAVTFTAIAANNLGSDSATLITGSSSGDAAAGLTDKWVTTMENYVGITSLDPRLGHVLWGTGASVQLASINFVNGDDNPYWAYSITLAPGQTGIIVHFTAGRPSKAEAATAAQALSDPSSHPHAFDFMSATEIGQVLNFLSGVNLGITATAAPEPVYRLSNLTYTITVTNAGPGDATNAEVAWTLPANTTFVSATLSQGTYTSAGSNYTFELGSLAAGGTATITLLVTPQVQGPLAGVFTASADQTDTDTTNNTVTVESSVIGTAPDLAARLGWVWVSKGYSRFRAQFDIYNYGEEPAGPFTLKAYLSRDNTLDAGDVLVHSQDFASLAGLDGEHLEVNGRRKNHSPRKYFITHVDTGNAVAEGNENNNITARLIPKPAKGVASRTKE